MPEHAFKKPYQLTFKELNVITQTESIPKTDLMLLYHSVDDLYIGLWNEKHQSNHWENFLDFEKVDQDWEKAFQ